MTNSEVYSAASGCIPGVTAEEAERRQRIERAAPELLAAAKVFLLAVAESSLTGDPIRADHETTVQLRAAIRKAEQG